MVAAANPLDAQLRQPAQAPRFVEPLPERVEATVPRRRQEMGAGLRREHRNGQVAHREPSRVMP